MIAYLSNVTEIWRTLLPPFWHKNTIENIPGFSKLYKGCNLVNIALCGEDQNKFSK